MLTIRVQYTFKSISTVGVHFSKGYLLSLLINQSTNPHFAEAEERVPFELMCIPFQLPINNNQVLNLKLKELVYKRSQTKELKVFFNDDKP